MQSIIADIRNLNELCAAMEKFRPEIVFHLAAQPLVLLSYKNPVETYKTNVMGTVNMLEAVRRVGGVRAVVNVTTDKFYDNKEWCWGYREDEPMGGFAPYSSSKGCAELVTQAFRNSFFNSKGFLQHGVAVATARAGNVIGGGDWAADRLVPDILRAIEQNEPVQIRNPRATRPWQHVLEPLSGYITLAQALYQNGTDYAQAWNFGPHDTDAKEVLAIVEKICELWGEGASYKINSGNFPHEANYLKLDISKASHYLGWKPRWTLRTALDKIVWFEKQRLSKSSVKQLCIQQIVEYMDSKQA